jgi:hypothetical protein
MFKALCLAGLLIAPAARGQGRLDERGRSRRFVSEKYGFSMAVPPGWFVFSGGDTPVFFNSAPPGGFFQGIPPKGGAVISVLAHETVTGLSRSARTPRDWALADAHGASSDNPSIKPLDMSRKSGVSEAFVSSYDETTFSPDEPDQHCVAVFWEFDRRLFAAQLNYLASDPNGPALTKLLLETVRSVRPIDRH